jgi:hypothetical protein
VRAGGGPRRKRDRPSLSADDAAADDCDSVAAGAVTDATGAEILLFLDTDSFVDEDGDSCGRFVDVCATVDAPPTVVVIGMTKRGLESVPEGFEVRVDEDAIDGDDPDAAVFFTHDLCSSS